MAEFELDSMRESFWERDHGGAQAEWEGIKVAAEAMINNDLELANTVLEARGITPAGGDMSRCFDSRGRMYELPRFVYSTPTNVSAGVVGPRSKTAVSAASQELKVRARVSYLEKEVAFTIGSHETAAALRTALHKAVGSDADFEPAQLRVFYSGRELTESDLSLEECGFGERGTSDVVLQAFAMPNDAQLAELDGLLSAEGDAP